MSDKNVDLWSGFANEVAQEDLERNALAALVTLNGENPSKASYVARWTKLSRSNDESLDFTRGDGSEAEATFTLNRMALSFETRSKALWIKELSGFSPRKEALPRLKRDDLSTIAKERIRRVLPVQYEMLNFSFAPDQQLDGCYRAEFMVGQNGKGFVDRAGYSVVWFDPYGRVLEFWQGGPYPRVNVPAPQLSEEQALQTALELIGEADKEKLVIADGYYELKDGSYTLMTLVARRPKLFIDEPTYRLYYAGNERGRVMVDRVSGEARVVMDEERSPFLERTDQERPRR